MSLPLSIRRFGPRLGSLAALALPLGLLAACAEAPPQSRSEQAQYDACRRIADRVVTNANADALAQTQNSQIYSPYSSTSILGTIPNTLNIQHQHQDVMADCMRHLDTGPANVGTVTATPQISASPQPITPAPADLAGPTGSDLTKPPILPPAQ
jgi:hypothetical protein